MADQSQHCEPSKPSGSTKLVVRWMCLANSSQRASASTASCILHCTLHRIVVQVVAHRRLGILAQHLGRVNPLAEARGRLVREAHVEPRHPLVLHLLVVTEWSQQAQSSRGRGTGRSSEHSLGASHCYLWPIGLLCGTTAEYHCGHSWSRRRGCSLRCAAQHSAYCTPAVHSHH